MTVGRVKDFSFPHSGPTQVRGYMRGGEVDKGKDDWGHKPTDKMAMGGMVKPPRSGIRMPRPASGVLAQRHAEDMAIKPGRGPKIGAKLAVAKPVAAPAPSMTPGALQSASTPMIPPGAPPQPGGMARGGRLNAAARKALPKSDFGMPGSRKYPMPDASHAANAKSRASQAVNAGRMSKAQAEKIDARADKVLGEK